MAFVDETQRSALLKRAMDALAVSDAARSHEIYREIVDNLHKLCNKNQKEIASELQQLAKSLESEGNADMAFEFKQRTCAVMLEISMEDRRRNRPEGLMAKSGTAEGSSGRPAETSFAPLNTISGTVPKPALPVNSDVDTGELDTIPAMTRGSTTAAPPAVAPSAVQRQVQETGTASDAPSDITRLQSSATAIDTALPFLNVEYLYIGSADYERDVNFYLETLGAQEVWKYERFGSRITALSLCAGPLILLADHRSAPSCQPVFRVSDLSATARELTQRGWKPLAGPFGTPNGEAYSFEDPSGNRFAIFEVDETSTDRAYYDPTDND